MKARIRNRLDEIVEKMYADASVGDQLSFGSWPDEAKKIARRAVALEIDAAAGDGSDADSRLGESIDGVKLHINELKDLVRKALALIPVGEADSDPEVIRASTLAEIAELDDAVGELEIAAEAEPA